MAPAPKTLLAVLYQHPKGSKHAGGRFWSLHDAERDARIRDWQRPPLSLIPLGAALVTVTEGEGLDLVERVRAATPEWQLDTPLKTTLEGGDG